LIFLDLRRRQSRRKGRKPKRMRRKREVDVLLTDGGPCTENAGDVHPGPKNMHNSARDADNLTAILRKCALALTLRKPKDQIMPVLFHSFTRPPGFSSPMSAVCWRWRKGASRTSPFLARDAVPKKSGPACEGRPASGSSCFRESVSRNASSSRTGCRNRHPSGRFPRARP
jgi:hypothetical protein